MEPCIVLNVNYKAVSCMNVKHSVYLDHMDLKWRVDLSDGLRKYYACQECAQVTNQKGNP